MPFEHTWENHGFYATFWGKVTEREIETKNVHFSNDRRCEKSEYQIFDGSGIDTFELSDQDITKMASNDIGMGFYLKRFSVVFVSTKPGFRKAIEQYISICQRSGLSWKFHICNSLPQARAWIKRQKKQETTTLGLDFKTATLSRPPHAQVTTTDTAYTFQHGKDQASPKRAN